MFPYKPVGWFILILAVLAILQGATNIATGRHTAFVPVRGGSSIECSPPETVATLIIGGAFAALAISFIRKDDD